MFEVRVFPDFSLFFFSSPYFSDLFYAHIEIATTFLIVNLFGFLVITRDHESYEGRH